MARPTQSLRSPSRPPSGPRPVSASYLRNAALHYLSGRSASVAMVRATLTRRAKRRLDVRTLDDDVRARIEATLAELVKLGLVDDARFAEGRAATLQRKGFSKRRIGLGLKLKGIDAATAADAIADDVDDLAQAKLFVERKRLGRWRRGGVDPALRDRELRALARAGFGFTVAAKALEGDAEE